MDINKKLVDDIKKVTSRNEQENIIHDDFLSDTFSFDWFKNYKLLDNSSQYRYQKCAFTNVPFGKHSDKAVQFLEKAVQLFDYICFILPSKFSSLDSDVYNNVRQNIEVLHMESFECTFYTGTLDFTMNVAFCIFKVINMN